MAFSEVKVFGAPLKMLGMAFFEVDAFGGKKSSKKEFTSETYTFLCDMVRSSARASSLVRARVAAKYICWEKYLFRTEMQNVSVRYMQSFTGPMGSNGRRQLSDGMKESDVRTHHYRKLIPALGRSNSVPTTVTTLSRHCPATFSLFFAKNPTVTHSVI